MSDQMLTIPEAVRDLQSGRMIILCDDEDRENEADICMAAQFATPEKINFIVRQACGLLCVALSGERLDALRLPWLRLVDVHCKGQHSLLRSMLYMEQLRVSPFMIVQPRFAPLLIQRRDQRIWHIRGTSFL